MFVPNLTLNLIIRGGKVVVDQHRELTIIIFENFKILGCVQL